MWLWAESKHTGRPSVKEKSDKTPTETPFFWLLGECVISSVLFHHNKNLKQWTLKPYWTDQCYSSIVTAQFHLNKGKQHPWGRRACLPKRRKETRARRAGGERERVLVLWPPLFMFFPPPGPALYKLRQTGVLFFLPEVLTRPWTFLCSNSMGFSLPCLLATTILDSFFLF